MKYMSFSLLTWILLAIACSKGEGPGTTIPPAAQKLEGKWILVKSEVSLTFNDGSTQKLNLPGSGADYIEVKFVKKDGAQESGTIKNVFQGDESTGDWVYFDADKSLDITYTSLNPHYFLFRTVQHVDEKSLILTADNAQVLNQYTLNNLDDLGSKKLTGGSIREEWKK